MEHHTALGDDCRHLLKKACFNTNPSREEVELATHVLIDIKLEKHGHNPSDLGLSVSPNPEADRIKQLFCASTGATIDQANDFEERASGLNADQGSILDFVERQHNSKSIYRLFVDGPAGCGKTYLLNVLIKYYRRQKINTIVVASSGVAALLLEGGATAHSKLKIPLQTTAQTLCSWSSKSSLGIELIAAQVLIWDEISMVHRYTLDTIDRSLRELRHIDEPFGGLNVLFGGDFRQTLPVVIGGSLVEQGLASVLMSESWTGITVFRLTTNMRMRPESGNMTNAYAGDSANWVLQIGEGAEDRSFCSEVDLRYCKTFEDKNEIRVMTELISHVYNGLEAHIGLLSARKLAWFYRARCILVPWNKCVDDLNARCLDLIPGRLLVSNSIDQCVGDDEHALPPEVLAGIRLPGFPAPRLALREGIPVVCLRNFNLGSGLSNGTRLLVTGIQPNVLKCVVMTGPRVEEEIMLPKICLIHEPDSKLSTRFSRYQFPVAPAFAMTVNKSQGQSLEKAAVYLPRPVFAHGQLYVALSRVSDMNNLMVGLVKGGGETRRTQNVVNLDVLDRLRS